MSSFLDTWFLCKEVEKRLYDNPLFFLALTATRCTFLAFLAWNSRLFIIITFRWTFTKCTFFMKNAKTKSSSKSSSFSLQKTYQHFLDFLRFKCSLSITSDAKETWGRGRKWTVYTRASSTCGLIIVWLDVLLFDCPPSIFDCQNCKNGLKLNPTSFIAS